MGNSSGHDYVYSYPLENSKKPGFSSVYRKPETREQLIVSKDPNVLTVQRFLETNFLQNFPSRNCLGI